MDSSPGRGRKLEWSGGADSESVSIDQYAAITRRAGREKPFIHQKLMRLLTTERNAFEPYS
jgi:hypothetical protein